MKSFAELETEDRRLVVLRLLEQASDYRGNAYLLQSALAGFGHSVSASRVETDLAWLAEQDLVTTDRVADVTIARATQRGIDVARGLCVVPGVKRPSPGA